MFVIDQNKTRTSTICQDLRVLFWSTKNKIYCEKILLITPVDQKIALPFYVMLILHLVICKDLRVLFWSTKNKIYCEKILPITLHSGIKPSCIGTFRIYVIREKKPPNSATPNMVDSKETNWEKIWDKLHALFGGFFCLIT